MSEAPRLEYAIRRLNWRRTHYGLVRMPGSITFGALPTLEEAETDRARREAEVRAKVNPFLCGPTHATRSHLPEAVFLDWLRDAGIEPPDAMAKLHRDWPVWWTELLPTLSAEQIAHVWNGLDRVRFFEVARPEGSVGYAVVRIEWEYNDQWDEPGSEGGTPVKVFRRWAAAEEYRRTLEEAERQANAPEPGEEANLDDHWVYGYDVTRWADEQFWPLGPPSKGQFYYQNATFAHGGQAPYYEVVEVELPPPGEGGP